MTPDSRNRWSGLCVAGAALLFAGATGLVLARLRAVPWRRVVLAALSRLAAFARRPLILPEPALLASGLLLLVLAVFLRAARPLPLKTDPPETTP